MGPGSQPFLLFGRLLIVKALLGANGHLGGSPVNALGHALLCDAVQPGNDHLILCLNLGAATFLQCCLGQLVQQEAISALGVLQDEVGNFCRIGSGMIRVQSGEPPAASSRLFSLMSSLLLELVPIDLCSPALHVQGR